MLCKLGRVAQGASGFMRSIQLAAYKAEGILLYEDGGGDKGTLIVTRDDEGGGIDAQAIAKLISKIF